MTTRVVIDGVLFVPAGSIPPLNDSRLKQCLEILTSMRYFKEEHKLYRQTWDAINALSPELAKLDDDSMYNRIHGSEDEDMYQVSEEVFCDAQGDIN